ncbi:DUF2024 family protein [Shewanella corallii]|uniref:DUF2024 family protein n=1 Tax=Shewanella corallii TaxID=560080 RepID=A0ABT0NAU0_9GAMM|nr:DUF2024 family protein [Shewanella corallii]MCL2915561.1 DUF2024 family protein [Shewanella corallii]
MNVHVYDTHVTTESGRYLHFDVLVDDTNVKNVGEYIQRYLKSLHIEQSKISSSRCYFCHSEIANPEVQQDIAEQGYSILPLRT